MSSWTDGTARRGVGSKMKNTDDFNHRTRRTESRASRRTLPTTDQANLHGWRGWHLGPCQRSVRKFDRIEFYDDLPRESKGKRDLRFQISEVTDGQQVSTMAIESLRPALAFFVWSRQIDAGTDGRTFDHEKHETHERKNHAAC